MQVEALGQNAIPTGIVAIPDQIPAISERRPLRFITCGSVDDGKSTLIGRLLWDTKSVSEDLADGLQRSPDQIDGDGLHLPEFAMLLDGLQAERQQGITIDVAYRYFSTPKRAFIVADTPGHVQYTRNMATGASTAELAILLVDARSGLLEQTRRHATIALTMGIRQLVLVVNKIDLVDYDQQIFECIKAEFSEFALSFDLDEFTAIPVSALKGENVVAGAAGTMPWYSGPTLLETLERATIQSAQASGFRFPVQRVSRPNESFRGYQGTIAGGGIKPGDPVVVLPSGTPAKISQIVTFDQVRNDGDTGDAITLVLDRPVDIARGDMIVSGQSQPAIGHAFDANLIVLSDGGIDPHKHYWLKSASRCQKVTVRPDSVLDLNSQHWDDCENLVVNSIARVGLDFTEVAIFDTYQANRHTGAFSLIDPDSNDTVAGGMITGQSTDVSNSINPETADTMVIALPVGLGKLLMASSELGVQAGQTNFIETTAKRAEQLLAELG